MNNDSRIQFELSEQKAAGIDFLMAETGIETRAELFNNALNILEWAVQQVSKGYEISAYKEDTGELHILNMRTLSRVSLRPGGGLDHSIAD